MLTLSLIKVTYKTATVLILLEHSLLDHIISLFHTIKKSIGKHCHVWLEHLFVFAEGQKLDNVNRTQLALASGAGQYYKQSLIFKTHTEKNSTF